MQTKARKDQDVPLKHIYFQEKKKEIKEQDFHLIYFFLKKKKEKEKETRSKIKIK